MIIDIQEVNIVSQNNNLQRDPNISIKAFFAF
jgi:hypothetical protein